MNERIRDLALESIVKYIAAEAWVFTDSELEKFVELIIAECKKVSLNEIVKDSAIDTYSDPLLREYLKGNNMGVVDSIVAIQQHFFGVEE